MLLLALLLDDSGIGGVGGVYTLRLSRDTECFWPGGTGERMVEEKERDLGMMREMVVGELGEGLLLRLPTGLDPGVLSREWRKLRLRVLQG